MKRLLDPARFRWLDRLPAPPAWLRIIPLFREHPGHHRLIPLSVPQPRHASGERINCGGLSRGSLPRRDALAARGLIDRGPDRAPWLTGEFARIAGEIAPPVNDDAETLRLYSRELLAGAVQL